MNAESKSSGVPVSALLLYRAPATAIATTYLHALNEAARDVGEIYAFADGGDDERWIFEGENTRVLIEASEGALTDDAFGRAMDHPFIDAVFPAGRAIVQGHRAYARVTVTGRGEADPTLLNEEDFEPAAMLPRLRLLRAAASAYAKQRFPLAVHWCPCENLLAGPDFVQMAERGAETELFVKAVPYSTQAEAGTAYGAVTSGAANVIGHEVELAEAPVPAAWAADRLLQFVEKARSGVPAPGDALRFPTDEIVLVHREEATQDYPAARLRLTVEKLPTGTIATAPEDASMGFLAEMDNRVAARGFGRR